MKIHRIYMQRCIEIAQNGLGTTAPNPMVGAVIVHRDHIIGEGFTSPYGGPHAEVNAIESVTDPALLSEAVIYVTLEPCSHFGKTPPCVDRILKHGIPEVVIGVQDPHYKVAGKGIQRLRDSGCKVTVGVLEEECRELHKRFLTFHEKKRPYLILKWAETVDGFIAPSNNKRLAEPQPYWITGSSARQEVHKWRSEEQAILVGTTTVLADNPKLDVRKWSGKSPIRVILDRNLKVPADAHVLDGTIPTLVMTEVKTPPAGRKNVDYVILDFSGNLAQQLCDSLYKRNITSVIIEGGRQTLQTFIDTELWDEARVFTGNGSFQDGIQAPRLEGIIQTERVIGNDKLKIFRR